MVLLRNTAEGGTNGAAVTTANSGGGSGDAFSTVGGSPVFASGGSHGLLSYQANANSTTTALTLPSSAQAVATRFYLMLLATPTAAGIFHRVYAVGNTSDVARLVMTTSRQIQVQNAAATTVTTLNAATLALNAWYRIELQLIVGSTTSNGTILSQVYQGDSNTALATFSAAGTSNTGTTLASRADVGRISGSGWGSGPKWDSVQFHDSAAPIGPVSSVGGEFLQLF